MCFWSLNSFLFGFVKYWIWLLLLALDFSKHLHPSLHIAVIVRWCPSASAVCLMYMFWVWVLSDGTETSDFKRVRKLLNVEINGQYEVLLKLLSWKADNGKPFICMKLVTTVIPNWYCETENLAYTEKERKPLMCRSGQQFWQCFAVHCVKTPWTSSFFLYEWW